MPRRPASRHLAYAALAATTSVAAALPSRPGRALDPRRIHAVTKLLLAPTLQAALLSRRVASEPGGTGALPPSRLVPLLTATTGSLIGDWFMLREGDVSDPKAARQQMRWGATAFGVQQGIFIDLLRRRGDRPSREAVLAVGGVLAALAAIETVRTRSSDPVLTAYGLLLGSMTALASGDADPRVSLGGKLFLASDAVIIIRQHLLRDARLRALAELGVMGSYAAALALLVEGLSDAQD